MVEKRDGLIDIVSTKNVVDDPEILDAYSRDCSLAPSRKPRLVVKPRDMDEVQGVVQWANQTKTPLVPVSSVHHTFMAIPCPVQEEQLL